MNRSRTRIAGVAVLGILSGSTPLLGQQLQVKLKEVLSVHEVRANTLEGRGLVTGLRGSGDGGAATRQALVSFLTKMNFKVRSDEVAAGNIALVHVSAQLRPFARHGTKLDVTVSSIGTATSLRGGSLLLTELRGADGEIYALASGPLTIGGFAAKGNNAKVTRNHPTAGSIPSGAICEPPVEKLIPSVLNARGELSFLLRHPSARTVSRAKKAINELLARKNCGFAHSRDDGQLLINLIPAYRTPDALTALRAEIEELQIEPAVDARLVINEKTGTIIVGKDVRISSCLVQISDLTIEVVDEEEVSQPLPGISRGTTEKVGRTRIQVTQETGKPQRLDGGASLGDLIQGLQALGIDGPKMMTVLLELHRVGFLHAEIVR